jgi:hypothetical protein
LLAPLSGCASAPSRYGLIEDSVRAGNMGEADQIMERAEHEYGSKSRALYGMDRGMTLHLAGRYQDSNAVLDQAEEETERLYTRRIRVETKAFLLNDTELPYEGESYERIMINVLKALNYGVMGNWEAALVEARRIDQRLNLLFDQTDEKDSYREDAFARYLTGILYEAAGELNDAFIAYRKAYENYRLMQSWSRVPAPYLLRADLLRVTDALKMSQEYEEYRQAFPDTSWQPVAETQHLAQIVVFSYNGRAPRKEDRFIDLPVSLDALKLVLLTKGVLGASTQETRAAESALYGLNGHVVRVAIPVLVPQKTSVTYGEISLRGADTIVSARTERAQNVTALAEQDLAEQLGGLAAKAVARAAVKYAMAEGAGRGAAAAAGQNNAGALIGVLVRLLAHTLAVGTEEADKRSWRTLPDEVQVARLWVPPGSYELRIRSVGHNGEQVGWEAVHPVILVEGETRFITERVLP